MITNPKPVSEEILLLRKQWEMVRQSLPEDEKKLEVIFSGQSEASRNELQRCYKELVLTRDRIERRLQMLESIAKDEEKDISPLNWQHLLMKIMLFGWPTSDDFIKLEGRMAETWPKIQQHASVAEWLPFTKWCEHHWIRRGRVSSICGFDVRAEIATRLSPPLKMALINSSQHNFNLSIFLGNTRRTCTSSAHRSLLNSCLGETGHRMALELPSGAVQAVLIGRHAWEKWRSINADCFEWMLLELASKAFYLAIELNVDEKSPPTLPGWIPYEDGPEGGCWYIWKTNTPIPENKTLPSWDLRSHAILMNTIETDRTAILIGEFLLISYGNVVPKLREREVWKSLSGLHPMLPSFVEDRGPLSFQLHLSGERSRWMPHGARKSSIKEDHLMGLFSLLQERELVPPDLGIGDFITTTHGTFLTRIGFEGYRMHGDPLESLLAIMAGWNLMEPPLQSFFKPDQFPSVENFPSFFRVLAEKALSAISLRDLISKEKISRHNF